MKSLLLSIAASLFGAACLAAAEPLRISSFSTVLTEIAEQVGGDRVKVIAHVQPGIDPHEFEPRPEDLKLVSQSDLILLSAKHMEGYVGKLKEATGGRSRLLEVGDQLPSLKQRHDHSDHAHGHDHKGDADPHWWHSVAHMQRATRIVRDALIALRPEAKAAFTGNAETYLARLDSLRRWMKSEVAKLPRDRRKLVTSHEAFQYFAQENGFTLYAIEGLSSADQPSSKKVAGLIELIRKQRVKAIFAEKIANPKVLTEITRETGAVLGGELYADGLGEGTGSTYDGMMRHNVTTIVGALK